jgi:hypothetical protein
MTHGIIGKNLFLMKIGFLSCFVIEKYFERMNITRVKKGFFSRLDGFSKF